VPARLLAADERELVLWRGLGKEVVDARLFGDGGRRDGLSPVIMTVRMVAVLRRWIAEAKNPVEIFAWAPAPDWCTATARYDLQLAGGASELYVAA